MHPSRFSFAVGSIAGSDQLEQVEDVERQCYKENHAASANQQVQQMPEKAQHRAEKHDGRDPNQNPPDPSQMQRR
jgi:hypothetical protein